MSMSWDMQLKDVFIFPGQKRISQMHLYLQSNERRIALPLTVIKIEQKSVFKKKSKSLLGETYL